MRLRTNDGGDNISPNENGDTTTIHVDIVVHTPLLEQNPQR